ncbi:hypothetical protein J1N35_044261 [Gossypium stocksii]|uniref:Uncharacterized protein n=1 Tax=Gossypium stocksii TaxID=47602 RepID=A0A9D3U8W0_9ROSI|nr:hypothetical protein J1N35_044261 [Gossypium stocksii]
MINQYNPRKVKLFPKKDGTTEIKFDHSHLQNLETPSVFPTILMMQPVPDLKIGHIPGDPACYSRLYDPGSERKLIESFNADGRPQYMFKDPKTGYYP